MNWTANYCHTEHIEVIIKKLPDCVIVRLCNITIDSFLISAPHIPWLISDGKEDTNYGKASGFMMNCYPALIPLAPFIRRSTVTHRLCLWNVTNFNNPQLNRKHHKERRSQEGKKHFVIYIFIQLLETVINDTQWW